MKHLAKLGAAALAGTGLAGCEQPAGTNNETGTEQSETADGAISTDADQPVNTMGIGPMQEPGVVVPLLEPTVPPGPDENRSEPAQPGDGMKPPADTPADTPE